MSMTLTRRFVLAGATAHLTVACSSSVPEQQAAAPAGDICGQLGEAMKTEVFDKVQRCRMIMANDGIPVTHAFEKQEIDRCMGRIKRLFDLEFVSFDVPDAPVVWSEGGGHTWRIGFGCDQTITRDGRQFVMRGKGTLVMDFRTI